MADGTSETLVRGLLALACDLRDEGYLRRDLEPWRGLAGNALRGQARVATEHAEDTFAYWRERHGKPDV